jgi:hypothetical protein
MGADGVVQQRREEREHLLNRARHFCEALPDGLDVEAVAVVGSVARGDWNYWSATDVLVLARGLPDSPLERLDALGPFPPRVLPFPWTPDEFDARCRRGDPMADEAVRHGIWLRGGPPAPTTG